MDIAVVTFNRARYLKKCLDALVENSSAEDDRILIVDNQSIDETYSLCLSAFDRIKNVFWSTMEVNRGCAGGRNYGFRWFGMTKEPSSYIAMFDDDIKVRPGWQEAALVVMDAHPDAGVVALIDDHRKEPLIARHRLGELEYLEKTFVNTAACVIRSEAFRSVGGYHESGRAMDWISTRFCGDLREKGWKIFVVPRMAENMDHPKHPDNERAFYQQTGYEAFRQQGKKRKVQLGEEGRFFKKDSP